MEFKFEIELKLEFEFKLEYYLIWKLDLKFKLKWNLNFQNSHFCLKLNFNVKFKCNSNLTHKFDIKSLARTEKICFEIEDDVLNSLL